MSIELLYITIEPTEICILPNIIATRRRLLKDRKDRPGVYCCCMYSSNSLKIPSAMSETYSMIGTDSFSCFFV